MRICITGTPGTGKTSVTEELEGFNRIDLTEFIREKGLGQVRNEIEVETEKVVNTLENEIKDEEDVVVEGHLSHHLPADLCIVLRCRPDVLKSRLSERDYSEQKIDENVQAEILDLILSETVEKQENILEIDTTERKPEDVAQEIQDKIKKNETGYGSIDWTEFL